MKLEVPIGILVRRRAALGDVVIATGVLRELKNKFGDNCVIDVATQHPIVFDNNPHVRNVIKISETDDSAADPSLYDVFYNLDDTYEYNPEVNFADSYFHRVFGTTEIDKSMELWVDDAQMDVANAFIEHIGGDFIAVHMRRWYWELKNIDPVIWMEVFNRVLAVKPTLKIVCVGGETDYFPEGSPNVIDGRKIGTPGMLSAVLDHAKCFVGIDSAPMHIAGASDAPIVALLSHMSPDKVLPYRKHTFGADCTVIQANVSCVGCHSRQQRPVRQIVCERGDYACNKLWDVDAIAEAIIKYL